jgi:hypothetical protein
MSAARNWFGRPPHPTDEFIPVGECPPDEDVDALRAAWDRLRACDAAALAIVVERVADSAREEALEAAA